LDLQAAVEATDVFPPSNSHSLLTLQVQSAMLRMKEDAEYFYLLKSLTLTESQFGSRKA